MRAEDADQRGQWRQSVEPGTCADRRRISPGDPTLTCERERSMVPPACNGRDSAARDHKISFRGTPAAAACSIFRCLVHVFDLILKPSLTFSWNRLQYSLETIPKPF